VGISEDYLHNQYGMSINRNMVDVDGRVLPAPTVTLGNNEPIIPRSGGWDMRGKKFYQGQLQALERKYLSAF